MPRQPHRAVRDRIVALRRRHVIASVRLSLNVGVLVNAFNVGTSLAPTPLALLTKESDGLCWTKPLPHLNAEGRALETATASPTGR